VFAVSRLDGARLSVPRVPQTWLVVRQGRPVVVAEANGRDLTPLGGYEAVDLPGVIGALQSAVERPPLSRPVRRLEVLTWNGRPVRETDAADALVDAGFTLDGARATWDGHPGPRHADPGPRHADPGPRHANPGPTPIAGRRLDSPHRGS
jgi:hypothetical protein